LKNLDSHEVGERIHENNRGRVQYNLFKDSGVAGEPVTGFMKRKSSSNPNKSSYEMNSNFHDTQYETPLSCIPGLRKNPVLHEWRKGNNLMRKVARSKRSPDRSPLARNAEINMFTGYVKDGPAGIDNKEVMTLRKLGVMVPGSKIAVRRRVNGVFDGGERPTVNIQGKTVSPKQKTAAPWDVIDSRQEARDIFKKNQFQRFHADDLKAGAPWNKTPRSDGRNLQSYLTLTSFTCSLNIRDLRSLICVLLHVLRCLLWY